MLKRVCDDGTTAVVVMLDETNLILLCSRLWVVLKDVPVCVGMKQSLLPSLLDSAVLQALLLPGPASRENGCSVSSRVRPYSNSVTCY